MTSPETPDAPSRPAVPQYGEYAAPGDPRFAQPPVESPPPVASAPQPIRRRDATASVVLLAIGFVSTVYTVLSSFELEMAMTQIYRAYGGTGDYAPAGDLGAARATLIVSHVVLLAAAALTTRALVKARRVSFWAPLVAGVIAGAFFFGTVTALVLGDPALLEAGMRFAAP